MSTSQVSPTGKEVRRQRTVLDLDNFQDVTLIKKGTFSPVTTAQEAMQRLGNDTQRFLAVVNDGLEQDFGNQLIQDTNEPWLVEDEDGKVDVFTGTPADSAKVNALVLNLAKSMENYNKDMTPEEKRAAKAAATETIRTTPRILEGLKKNCVA